MIAFMFTALMIYAVCDMNRRNVIYYAVRAYTFGELAGALGWQLVCYVFENRRVSYSAAIQCLITVGTVAVLFVIVLLAEKRINRDQKHIHIEKREVILSAVMCICMIAASNLSYVSSSTPFSSRIPSDIYIIRTIVDLAGVSILTAYHIILKESHEKMEMAQMAALNRMQFANYQISRTSVDLINQKYHDLKHQIEFLKSDISSDEKMQYLNEMEQDIQAFEAQNHTGNHILDTILTAKSLQCQNENIQLTCVANGKYIEFMNPMDISALFGNMLDNAIEGVSKVEEKDKRWIHVSIRRKMDFLVICVSNSYQGDISFSHGMPVTQKEDKRYHGYGTKSIRNIVSQYGGTVVFRAEKGWFEVKATYDFNSLNQAGQL